MLYFIVFFFFGGGGGGGGWFYLQLTGMDFIYIMKGVIDIKRYFDIKRYYVSSKCGMMWWEGRGDVGGGEGGVMSSLHG